MNFINTTCIRIPLQLEGESWCTTILQHLTRSGPSYENPDVMVTTKYYDKRDGHILIPRYYPVENYGHVVNRYIPDGKDIDIEFNKEWRNDLQKSGFEFLTQNDYGILKLPPGEGKTVIAIGAICKIKKKTIIFVHKDSLVTQWKERFLEHSDIKEEDIGILTTDKCHDKFVKPIVLSTTQTMVSMLQRVPNIETQLLNAGFGMAIWDECHTTAGAESYSKTSLYMPCKRHFGLSATPARADKNHDVIGMHLGLVNEPEGETNTMAPKVIMVKFDHKAVAHHKKYIYFGAPNKQGVTKNRFPKFDTARYLAMLTSTKNDTYIPYAQKIAKRAYQVGRVTLLISDRIKVLDKIAPIIKNKSDVGFFIPRSKDKRDAALYKPFVFSTPGSSRDGTDRDELDCLIMANCISNIEQAIGRVCRFRPNKPQPIVFDFVDTGCEEMVDRAEWREDFYKKMVAEKGWELEIKNLK